MNCALRTIVCAFVTTSFIFSHTCGVSAKGLKDHATVVNNNAPAAAPDEFRWNEHNKLSWEDFRGPVNATNEESAAATHCGIGFKTYQGADGKPQISVYNTFYANRSWVRSDADAKVGSVLAHEQGHFDLCEIYTRILRVRMSNFNFNVADPGKALMSIYAQVKSEYEARQQDYEAETSHGTVLAVQNRWQNTIAKELSVAGNSYARN